MSVDLALKPSRATYTMRPDHEDPEEKALERAPDPRDNDAHVLGMVGRQVDSAHSKLRTCGFKQAIVVLRRAVHIAEGQASNGPKAGAPAPLLAVATARLHLAILLSRTEKHEQAEHEARLAKERMDKLWSTLSQASADDEAAMIHGDKARMPPPHLRAVILQPPPWLSQAIEVAVQVRQCLAMELEYQMPRKRSSSARFHQAKHEVETLHMEASAMARQLLPEESDVRRRAEQAHSEMETRMKNLPAGDSESSFSDTASVATIEEDKLPLLNLGPGGKRLSMSFGGLVEPGGRAPNLSASMPLIGAPGDGPLLQRSSEPGFRAVARGDVYHASLPRRRQDPKKASAKQKALQKSKSFAAASAASAEEVTKDPFSDWKKSFVDVNTMSLSQIKAQSDEGLSSLHTDLKWEANKFKKFWLAETDQDHLYENRVHFSNHGVQVRENCTKEREKWKSISWEDSERGAFKKQEGMQLYSYYGTEQPPDRSQDKNISAVAPVKAIKKLMQESFDRSPAEIERKMQEKLERQRANQEERRKREEEQKQKQLEKLTGFAALRSPKNEEAGAKTFQAA